MHIKKVEIKDWIGIKEQELFPGKINMISGDSGVGKTSIVEAIEMALTKKNRRTEVINHDAAEAEILVELDNGMQINRKLRKDKADYLKVKHDSQSVSSTESFLRKFVSGEIFRPIEFVKQDPKKQAEIILNMLQINWTIDDIKNWFGEVPEADYQVHILQILNQIEQGYYKERESINREINLLRANIEGIKRDLPPNYDGEHWQKVNLQELYNALTLAEQSNRKLDDAKQLIDGLAIRIEDIQRRSQNAEQQKQLDYNRQRDNLTASIQRLEDNIQREQSVIDDTDRRIAEESNRLDNELEQAIERLRLQYQAKKQGVREEIQASSQQSQVFITEYKEQLADKKAQLSNIEELERRDLEKIKDHETNLIATENEKTGNAQDTVDSVDWIDTEPLKVKADEAAQMKEHLRQWDMMVGIIKDKLAPKQERSAELTSKIETARTLPKELLKTASLPIDGLTVDDQGRIRINNTLIDGLSEGEALDFAFRLAKAQAGELKVICVDGWQNLGSHQKEIIESAMTDDYQYFILSTVEGQPLQIESMEG